jgi:hypothetical protein
VLITGIRSRTSNLNFGLVNYLIKDIMNPAYGEADYMMPFGGSGGHQVSASASMTSIRGASERI